MKRKLFLFTLTFLSVTSLFAFTPVSTNELLLSYLENDIDLQKATLQAEKANLSYESTLIDNGINVNLSTGSISLRTSKDGLSVKASPTVKLVMPELNNLSISAKTSLTVQQGNSNPVTDTNIALDIDITSNDKLQLEINKETAERNKLTAIRNLETKALEKEKAFYNDLKNILNSYNTIVQAQSKLYNDLKDFESIQAKGYSQSSSKYRTAELQVLSDKNSIESSIKTFINDYILFYKKCGIDIDLTYGGNFQELLPTDLTEVELLNVEDFDKEKYIEIENAKWTHEINSKKRKLNSSFSLSVNSGYTFKNSLTNSDTVNLGVNSTIGGANLSLGMNIPTTTDPYPTFTINAGVNPNTFRKNNIKTKQEDLAEQQELLDIQTAEINYDNFVISSKQKYEELLWKEETTKKNYDMYEDLRKDMGDWYKEGVVSESDYLSAITNANLYKVKMLINQIDLLIYNNDITRKFIQKQ